MLLAIARHGEYEQPSDVPSAHLPHPLTQVGRTQGRALGEAVVSIAHDRKVPIHPVIDASSLLRAFQTAELAAARIEELGGPRCTIETFDALAERCVGSMANLRVDEIEAILERDPRHGRPPADWKASPDYRLPVPGAESMMQAGARVAHHIETRAGALDGSPPALKLFVGHGGAFRHAAVHLGVLRIENVRKLSMHHARPLVFEPATSGFEHVSGEWKQRGTRAAHD